MLTDSLAVARGLLVGKVAKSHSLLDAETADGGCDSTVMTRIRAAWVMFHEYLLISIANCTVTGGKGPVSDL